MSEKKIIFLDFLIRHAWHRVSRMYNQKAITQGMTMSVGFILMIVEKSGTLSTQLGPKMGMEPTSLSRTLNAMEKSGLIERKNLKGDKRKVNIFLTDKGIQSRRMVKNFLLEFNEKISSKVKERDVKGFFNVMNALDLSIEEVDKEKNTKS
ncbi:MAG: MarR family transcriptional regulator [Crocinitomicaceae bacterium]|jgi:MarR family transcriptional regulator, organic hydroperoxide resistance regulator|nr:MarR family transcriptional regulator [Crocinitomicaceae bacterium]